MEQVVITVARSVFLAAFLLAVSQWPQLVRRRAPLLLGHAAFAASLVAIPAGMLYYEMTWDDQTQDTLRFFARVRIAHYSSLIAAFVFAIVAVFPFPGVHESLTLEKKG